MNNNEKLSEIRGINAALNTGKISSEQFSILSEALQRSDAEYFQKKVEFGLSTIAVRREIKFELPRLRRNHEAPLKASTAFAEKTLKEKSLALAIGLNFIFPGLGYFYLSEIYRGILALFITLLLVIFSFSSPISFLMFGIWLPLSLILFFTIDMIILHRKYTKKLQEQTMKPCPHCAELILKQAMKCKHCGTALA
ncbi:MAG: hypothetical protein EOM20_21340 [Spartobacteria bacterium]|nr:hypothetical protein [Spartobacteria bacterium]